MLIKPVAILATCWLLLCQSQEKQKLAPPSAAEQAESDKLIKELFKDDYLKKSPSDRLSLSKKMLAQALQSKDDPIAQYVLFREARDLAAQAGDVPAAFMAIDEMSKVFAFDAATNKSGLIAGAAKSAKSPEDFKNLASASLKLVDPFLSVDDYEGAEKLAASTITYAKKSQDVPLTTRAMAKSKEVSELKSRFEKLKKAKETLASDPGDPAANLLMGRFQCLVKGNWAVGIPYLAKASDPGMRTLAERELLNPEAPTELIALGDAWWELADKETAQAKDNMREHAAALYLKSLPRSTGITRTKLEKRLSELGAAKLAKGNWVDASDPKNFGQQGKLGDPIELSAKPGFYQNLRMSQFPKGEFDGLSVRVTIDSSKPVMGWVIYEPKAFAAFVDSGRGIFVSASDTGKTWHHDFSTPWSKKDESTIAIVISEGEYVVYLDSREMTRFKTLNTRIDKLLLEVRDGAAKFDRIQLRRAE